jgi:hypothetical protein
MAALAAQGEAPPPDPGVMRRVSGAVRRIAIEWHGLGCSYDTPAGPKVVLQVGWRARGREGGEGRVSIGRAGGQSRL